MTQVVYQGVTLTVNMDAKVWNKLPKEAQEAILGQLFQAAKDLAVAKAAKVGKLSLKVGEKKNVCLVGLGRFPVSLYANQWVRLLGEKDAILAFIEANKANLSFEREAAATVEKV